jgi:hypothetical protein
MSRGRNVNRQDDQYAGTDGRDAAANDETAVPLCGIIPLLALPGLQALLPSPANDDWIETDLPGNISVLNEEIALLDQFLRAQILALFD